MVAAVAPEPTVATPPVFPVAVLDWSTAPVPDAVDNPEYSTTLAPMSALPDAVTVTVGLVPPPAVTGADHTLICV